MSTDTTDSSLFTTVHEERVLEVLTSFHTAFRSLQAMYPMGACYWTSKVISYCLNHGSLVPAMQPVEGEYETPLFSPSQRTGHFWVAPVGNEDVIIDPTIGQFEDLPVPYAILRRGDLYFDRYHRRSGGDGLGRSEDFAWRRNT